MAKLKDLSPLARVVESPYQENSALKTAHQNINNPIRWTPPGPARTGFRYQDLHILQYFLNWLNNNNLYYRAWIDQPKFKSLNDLVFEQNDKKLEMIQIKFTTRTDNTENKLSWHSLANISNNARSWLQKWFDSWNYCRTLQPISKISIITNQSGSPEFLRHMEPIGPGFVTPNSELPIQLHNQLCAHLQCDNETLKEFLSILTFNLNAPEPSKLFDICQRQFRNQLGGTDKGFDHLTTCINQWSDTPTTEIATHGVTFEHLEEAALITLHTREGLFQLMSKQIDREILLHYPQNTLNEIQALYTQRIESEQKLTMFLNPWELLRRILNAYESNLYISEQEKDKLAHFHKIFLKAVNNKSLEELIDAVRIINSIIINIISNDNWYVKQFLLSIKDTIQQTIQMFSYSLVRLTDRNGNGKSWMILFTCRNLPPYPRVLISGNNQKFFTKETLPESLFWLWNKTEPEYQLTAQRIQILLKNLINKNEFLIIFLDGIDKHINDSLVKPWLLRCQEKIDFPIKIVVACRDIYWYRFASAFNDFGNQKHLVLAIGDFNEYELSLSINRYATWFKIDNEKLKIKKIPKNIINSPLHLRLYFHLLAQGTHTVPNLANMYHAITLNCAARIEDRSNGKIRKQDAIHILHKLAEIIFDGQRHASDPFTGSVDEQKLKQQCNQFDSGQINLILDQFLNDGLIDRITASDPLTESDRIEFVRQDYCEYSIAVYLIKEIKLEKDKPDIGRWFEERPALLNHPSAMGIIIFLLNLSGKQAILSWIQRDIWILNERLVWRNLLYSMQDTESEWIIIQHLLHLHSHPERKDNWHASCNAARDRLFKRVHPFHDWQRFFETIKHDSSNQTSKTSSKENWTKKESTADTSFINGNPKWIIRVNDVENLLQKQQPDDFWLNYFPQQIVPLISSSPNLGEKRLKALLRLTLHCASMENVPIQTKGEYLLALLQCHPDSLAWPIMARILITDSDISEIFLLKAFLKNLGVKKIPPNEDAQQPITHYGIRFDLIEEKEEVIDRITNNPPDILVTDILRDTMDGFALARFFRNHNKNGKVAFRTAR
ncbi:MAG: hypothetical protein HQM01_13740, partial [Magnetococcales bacterium]|nr:hypothetical protein [Magnetococcales bacterium]